MKPSDLPLFRSYGRPAVAPDGTVFAALSTPDLAGDRYGGVLHRLEPAGPPREFTHGPRDSAPVLSPDGTVLVFLRAGESGPAQLSLMRTGGGEPRQLTDASVHPLGASAVTFSPDGRSIAYLAPVVEPGRYGSPGAEGADQLDPEAEAPRRITRMSYRGDGKGFLLGKPEQIFLLDLFDEAGAELPDAAPRPVTAEPGPLGRPAFTADGREVLYVRRAAVDSVHGEIAAVPSDADEPGIGRTVVHIAGDAAELTVHGKTVYYIGSAFAGNDFAGQTDGLWAAPLAGGSARRLTDVQTVQVDAMAGAPVLVADKVVVAVAGRGSVSLRAVPVQAHDAPLDDLPVIIGGRRVVKAFTVAGSLIAATVAGPGSAGDIVTAVVAAAPDADSSETVLTDVSAPLRAAGLCTAEEITGTAPDGYPVHGFMVLPPPDRFAGPHPVLLAVHGGPHSAYTWAVFDEAQMYAAQGYAVVLPNPRGSAGYGLEHGRCIVGQLGTIDADDVLALLDAALRREDCDAGRVGVMGGSYGGFMTSWLASHAADRFVAGISERAVNAWDSFTGASDIGYFFADGYVGSDRDEQWARSPLAHADQIGIPLLIIHSEQDWRCPLEQAQRLFVALKQRGHETEMLVFPGEGHELSRSGRPRHRQQRFEAILDWWSRYLPVG